MRNLLVGLFSTLALVGSAAAQSSFPVRPIKIVYPFLPGPAETAMRLVANKMSADLGQPIIVESKPGANGRIGTQAVATAAPDGYTVLITAAGPITIGPQLEKVNYDPIKDLIPVSQLVSNDAVIVVSKSFPAQTFSEFVAVVKASPGKYSYGTAGTGGAQHIAGELLKDALGLDMRHVPYKGDSAALTDLIGGHIPITISAMSSVSGFISSGMIRPIVSMGATRYPTFPNLPTLNEGALRGFRGGTWLGFFVPARTPAEIVTRLHKSLATALADPSIKEKLIEGGNHVVASSPKEFEEFLKDEYQRYGQAIKTGRIEK